MTVSHQGTVWCFRMAPVKIPTLIIIIQRNEASWNIFPLSPTNSHKVCPTHIDWYFKIYEHKEEMQAKISCVTENPCFAPERAQKQMSPSLKEGVPLSSYVSGVIFVAPRYLLLSMRRPLLHFSTSLLF